jgi:hypothetical protein
VATRSPDNDDGNRAHEGPGSSEDAGGFSSGDAEGVLDKAEDILLLRLFPRFAIVGFSSDGNYWIALAALAARFPSNLFFPELERLLPDGSRPGLPGSGFGATFLGDLGHSPSKCRSEY